MGEREKNLWYQLVDRRCVSHKVVYICIETDKEGKRRQLGAEIGIGEQEDKVPSFFFSLSLFSFRLLFSRRAESPAKNAKDPNTTRGPPVGFL